MQPMKRISHLYILLLTIFTLTLGAGAAMAADPTPAPVQPTGSDRSLGNNGKPVCVALPILSGQAQAPCPAGTYFIDNDPAQGGAIISYLRLLLRLANMLVGAVVVLVLIIAGFQYITSAGDPTNTKKAKGHITNALTALVLYMLMVAILNFLLPGGAF